MHRRRAMLAASVAVVALAVVQLAAVVTHAVGTDEDMASGLAAVPSLLEAPAPAERDLDPYRGVGAWVDLYDLGHGGGTVTVTPDAVDDMADAGVRTLYLQAARDEPGAPARLYDPALLGPFLWRAHERDMRVVGWYVPRFGDVERDLAHLRAIAAFEVLGHRFDGVAVDIEWTDTVPDADERSARLVELSTALRADAGSDALAAIVMPPVQLDVVNPAFWPGFPWDELAPLYDTWLPMGYWTDRTAASGYRDAATYTTENLRRLEDHLGEPVPVHAIGGLGADTVVADIAGFADAVHAEGAIGASIYDWASLSDEARHQLSASLDP